MYLIAIFFPPLAVLLCGKPFQFLFNILLTICGWVPGVFHAFAVINEAKAEGRNAQLMRAIRSQEMRLHQTMLWQAENATRAAAGLPPLPLPAPPQGSLVLKGILACLALFFVISVFGVLFAGAAKLTGTKASHPPTGVRVPIQTTAENTPALAATPPASAATPHVQANVVATPINEKEARTEALKKYPALGDAKSPLNRLFVERYNEIKAKEPDRLKNPRWPMILAEECAAKLPR